MSVEESRYEVPQARGAMLLYRNVGPQTATTSRKD
jgi:hypothetical protein